MSGVITAGAAVWCLVFALVLHLLVAGRVGDHIPTKVGSAVLPRVVSGMTLAGVAGLTVVTVGAWLHAATTRGAAAMVRLTRIPASPQVVVAALALAVAVSVVTWVLAGYPISARYVGEIALMAALLAAIPGVVGDFLTSVITAVVRAGAWVVGVFFGVI